MTRYEAPKPFGFFRVLFTVARIGVRASEGRFYLFLALNIINGVLTGLYAPLLNRFFDAVSARPASAALPTLFAFAAVLIGEHVVNGLDHSLSSDLHLRLRGDGFARVGDKAARMRADWFEDPAFLTHLAQAREGARYDWTFFIPLVRFVALYLPSTVVIGAYLFTLAPAYPFLLLLVYLPTAFNYFVRAHFLSKLEDEAAPIRREREHDRACAAGDAYFKETRALGAHDFFIGKFADSTARLVFAARRRNRRAFCYELACTLLTVAGYAGILFTLLRALRRGAISAGAFAAVFTTLNYLFMLADETLGHMLAPMNGIATVRHFASFLDLPEARVPAAEAPDGLAIDAENLVYRYPGDTKNAVDGVTLKVKRGETVAIVGLNGSGKTTLVKLLTGLYAPASGALARTGRTSAVFQNVQRYPLTLRENVTVSDPERAEDGARAEKCLRESAVDAAALADGLDTPLGRALGGAELSGGQWQRVALARGLYRTCDVIALDEPTAAIDPIEESRLYGQFRALADGKAALLVTHRIGSARIADRIVVMDAGRIAEQGTHETLSARGGLYKKLLDAQAKWYQT
jgi:ATP-binding cassette subfamily B protein